jgi:hypothetical protein
VEAEDCRKYRDFRCSIFGFGLKGPPLQPGNKNGPAAAAELKIGAAAPQRLQSI